MKAVPGDLILIMSGEDVMKTRKQLCELRLEMGTRLGLRDKNKFSLLWVVDFSDVRMERRGGTFDGDASSVHAS